jgi:hypothetical protein
LGGGLGAALRHQQPGAGLCLLSAGELTGICAEAPEEIKA